MRVETVKFEEAKPFMATDSSKENAKKKSHIARVIVCVIVCTLLGVVISVDLFRNAFEPTMKEEATSVNNIPPLPTEKILPTQIPSKVFENEILKPLLQTKTSLFSGDLEKELTGPFERDSSPSILRNRKASDDDEEEEERSEKRRAEFAHDADVFRNLTLKDEKGEIPLDGIEKARDQVKEMQAEQKRLAESAGKPGGVEVAGLLPGDWSWLGPGNIGGRIRTIAIHPTDPNKMWVGSVGGGIWRTPNAGTTWFPVDDLMANLAVSTIVIVPTNPNIMYAGTGEGFSNADSLRGNGIFKSTDGGLTWNQLAKTKISDLTVCPAGTPCPWTFVNRLAISPDGITLLAATASGMHRSTDGGATWTRVTANLTRAYMDVDFDPTNSQLAVAASDGLTIYTTDGGQTWGDGGFSPGINADGRVELAYAPSSSNIVYASVDRNGGEVYKSNNGGQTFNIINTGNMLLGTQGDYANIIWVNPQDPAFVLIGGLDIWRSTDGGANFAQISRWQNAPTSSAHADHHMIVASPAFNNTTNKIVYFGNDGGIYRTNNVSTVAQTTGWTSLNNGIGITQLYSGAGNYTDILIGGAQDNGNLRSTAAITNGWTDFTGGDGGFVGADPWDANYFYTEYVNLSLQRSTNGGASASYIYCNPVPVIAIGGPCTGTGILDAGKGKLFANFIAPFILDPNEPNRVLAGGISLWRSNNIKAAGLPTWTAVKDPAAPRPPAPGDPANPTPPISAISVAQRNSDFVVVGHNDGQIYLTQNGLSASPTWSRIDNNLLPQRFATRIAIDETRSPVWIYATFGGFSGDNVYRTENLGASWIDITGSGITGLPDVPVRTIAVNPARPNRIYVGTEIGIFASDDAGATWQLPQGGPANVSVDELFFNNGVLLAATHGRGMYKIRTPLYASPKCYQPTTVCSCAGEWNCGCSWASGFRPDATSDVVVSCPMTIGTITASGAVAKSLRVNSDLRIFNGSGLTISEDFSNYGYTGGNTVGGGGLLTARNFYSGGTFSMSSVDVTGDMTIGGTMIVPGLVEASGNISADANTFLSAGNINAYGNFWYYSNNPLTLTTDLAFGKDLYNQSRIQGRFLSQIIGSGGPPRIYSGPGVLKFQNSSSGVGITFANDKTFEVGTFYAGGPLNLGTNSITFNDNISLTGLGAGTGTGTIFINPRTGVNCEFSCQNSSFTPTLRFASGTAVLTGSGNLIAAPIIIDAGATLAANQSSADFNNNLTVNGTLTTTGGSNGTTFYNFNGSNLVNNGTISNNAGQNFVLRFNGSNSAPQTISGTGSWSPRELDFGNFSIATNITLADDMTFTGTTLQIQSSSSLGGNVNLAGKTLTHTGSTFNSTATTLTNGTYKIQPAAGTYAMNGGMLTQTGLRIASGTTTLGSSINVGGPLTVDTGATLSLASGYVFANGDVTVNGSLTGASYGLFLQRSGTFLNNGSVVTSLYLGPGSGANVSQNIGGTGTWGAAGTTMDIRAPSTVALLNDITFGGATLSLQGTGTRMNTGVYTFSFPCTTTLQNTGEIFGNVRRTNLAACVGTTMAFGNPFTTIQFTSGTPPSDIRVGTTLVPPVGFPNAVRRSYLITPTGGSGYAATLRLHYLDSELNGNSESTLQLWRNNGSSWNAQGATSRDSSNNWVEYAGVTQFSPWAISGFTPTAAQVSISGRVTTAEGRGVRNAFVSLIDSNGAMRSTLTGPRGYYRFDDIEAGQTVVISVRSRRFQFTPRSVSVQDELADVDFIAEP